MTKASESLTFNVAIGLYRNMDFLRASVEGCAPRVRWAEHQKIAAERCSRSDMHLPYRLMFNKKQNGRAERIPPR